MSLAETHLRGEADGCETPAAATPALRSGGILRLEFKRRGDATVLDRLYQSGCLKARLFRPEPRHCAEAVLLNTSGGVVGGDRLSHDIQLGACHACGRHHPGLRETVSRGLLHRDGSNRLERCRRRQRGMVTAGNNCL